MLMSAEMIGGKVEVDIGLAPAIDLGAMTTAGATTTVVAMTTEATVAMTTVADIETMTVIAVVEMISTEVAMIEIEVMLPLCVLHRCMCTLAVHDVYVCKHVVCSAEGEVDECSTIRKLLSEHLCAGLCDTMLTVRSTLM